jgi:hypothetical protein
VKVKGSVTSAFGIQLIESPGAPTGGVVFTRTGCEAAWRRPYITIDREWWTPPRRKRARVKVMRFRETTLMEEMERQMYAPNALFHRIRERVRQRIGYESDGSA